MRRSKLSAKKRAIAAAGCVTFRSMLSHGAHVERRHRHDRRNDQQAEPGGDHDVLAAELNGVAGRHHHQQAGQHDQRRDAADRPRHADQHGDERAGEGRQDREEIDDTAGRTDRPADARSPAPARAAATAIPPPARPGRPGPHAPSRISPICRSHATKFSDHRFRRAQARQHRHARRSPESASQTDAAASR